MVGMDEMSDQFEDVCEGYDEDLAIYRGAGEDLTQPSSYCDLPVQDLSTPSFIVEELGYMSEGYDDAMLDQEAEETVQEEIDDEAFCETDYTDTTEWYEDPYTAEFLEDFDSVCWGSLEDTRQYLLDMITPEEDVQMETWEENEQLKRIKGEMVKAIKNIGITGRARESLHKLHQLVELEPTINLRPLLCELDNYHLAYTVWGLSYLDRKNGQSEEELSDDEECNEDNEAAENVDCGEMESDDDLGNSGKKSVNSNVAVGSFYTLGELITHYWDRLRSNIYCYLKKQMITENDTSLTGIDLNLTT